jgi:peptidoglycan/LPS O-acetylase OafA/YrhL
VLGNYLFKTTRKFNLLLLISLFLTGFLYTAIRTYFISIQENETNELFMDNLSLNVCLMSFCVYLICKHGNYAPHSTWQRAVDIICRYSYGMYLSHLLILNIFLRLGLKFEFIHPIISIPLITITCLLISCGLIMVMKKIPVLKMLAG